MYLFSVSNTVLFQQLNQSGRLKIETMKLYVDRAGKVHWVPDSVGTSPAVSWTERHHWQVRGRKRLAITPASYQSCVNAMNTWSVTENVWSCMSEVSWRCDMPACSVPFSNGWSAFHDFGEVYLCSWRGKLPSLLSQCQKFIFWWRVITKHPQRLPAAGSFFFGGA